MQSLLFFITLALCSSCCGMPAPVDIRDEPLYYIKGRPDAAPGDQYAVQMFFLSSGQTDLTKADFDAISQGLVAMPLQSFDDFNKEIAEACSEANCDYIILAKVKSFMSRLHNAAYK